MKRIFWIAWREFVATVGTKGFIIGILFMPVLIAVMLIFVVPIMLDETPPRVEGELLVLDSTGVVVEDIAAWLEPEEVARRAGELAAEVIDAVMPGVARGIVERAVQGDQALEAMLAQVPDIEVVPLALDADIEAEKQSLLIGSTTDGGRLAVAVVHPDAVERDSPGAAFGDYDLFVRERLDERIEDEIRGALRDAIITGRVQFSGLDRVEIEALTSVRRVPSTTVTQEGEQQTNEAINVFLPAAFMILLIMAVMTGGQHILLSTVEEKRSRVVEVLLSAVSPMQLMAGKILGQLCVGFVMMGLYGGLGLVALMSLALLGFVDLSLIFYLVIFYLIAYCTLGSWMAAIGSAVNEITEAQALMMPVMITMMVPWLMWLPITRDPNGMFAVATSFVPPINTFVMLLRMSSTTPPPLWQVWLSILVGIAGVYAALWAATKVFRVGLLMYGKPPNLPTLWRWIRHA